MCKLFLFLGGGGGGVWFGGLAYFRGKSYELGPSLLHIGMAMGSVTYIGHHVIKVLASIVEKKCTIK